MGHRIGLGGARHSSTGARAWFGEGDKPLRGAAIGVGLAYWSVGYGLVTLRAWIDHDPAFGLLSLARIGLALAGGLLCMSIHFVLGWAPHRSGWRLIAVAVALSVAAAIAFVGLNAAVQGSIAPPGPTPSPGAVVMGVGCFVWFFLAWTATDLALTYSARLILEQRLLARERELLQSARLQALRYQVNPHFLFNTLNAVSTLIADARLGEAEETVARLSTFFRASLIDEPKANTPLANEIATQQAYLEIERVRFPHLALDVSIAPEVEAVRVPTLLLQPLVENAVKFGVGDAERSARVAIRAWCSTDRVFVAVEDSGAGGTRSEGTGTGLANVHARLRAAYGERARLSHGPRPSGGFRVLVELPR